MDTLQELNDHQSQSIVNVRTALSSLRSLLDRRSNPRQSFYCTIMLSGQPGRPSLYISQNQLAFLNNFSVPQIAEMFGVSIRTIRRRMADYGLYIREQYTRLSDHDLDIIVNNIQQQFPRCGNSQIKVLY